MRVLGLNSLQPNDIILGNLKSGKIIKKRQTRDRGGERDTTIKTICSNASIF